MPKKNSNTFVLNDETKVNSYGFRTLNKGIDQKRFKKNPVLLDSHWSSNQRVIGRWKNIRIEGSKLLADAEFDSEDENAVLIEGKVKRGFLKGVSMGLNPDRDSFVMEASGAYVLNKCELMEASIVAIPSNSNAIKLYSSTGEVLKSEEIQLSLEALINNQNQTQMNKITLSVAALTLLGLSNTEDHSALSLSIEKLTADFNTLKAQKEALESKLNAQAKTQAESLVNQAIADKKLTADTKDAWVKLAMDDFDTASKTIAAMQGAGSLSATLNNEGETGEVKSQEDFLKLSHAEQLSFKEENPEQYKKLFA